MADFLKTFNQGNAFTQATPDFLKPEGFTNTGLLQDASGIGQAAPAAGGGFMKSFGMASDAIGAVSDIYGLWNARQNLKLARDAFKFNKQLSTLNLNNQATLTNERLATRQATRNTYIPNSVPAGEFMKTYSVKGIGG